MIEASNDNRSELTEAILSMFRGYRALGWAQTDVDNEVSRLNEVVKELEEEQ